MAKTIEQIKAELQIQTTEVLTHFGTLVATVSEDIAYLKGTTKTEAEAAALVADVIASSVKLPFWVPNCAVKFVIARVLEQLGKQKS